MAKVWYSAAELAGLPGMPKTERAVLLRGRKLDWNNQPKTKGKGIEFNINSLPAETIQHLMGQSVGFSSDIEHIATQIIAQTVRDEAREAKKKQLQSEEILAQLSSLGEQLSLIHI